MEFDINIIRLLCAFFCGSLLSLSGSLTQHASQNNLAGPSTLGFDGVGVVFVLLAYFFDIFFKVSIPIELVGLIFFIPFMILPFILKVFSLNIIRNQDIGSYVLIGLCFNLFVGAIFSVIQFMFVSLNIEFPSGLWFGNFRFINDVLLYSIAIFFVIFYFLSIYLARDLSLLSLGEGISQNLNLDINKIQKRSLVLSLLITVVVINLFGVFSFLSLIFPLLIRRISYFKGNVKKEIVIGTLIAGASLSVIDFLCFNILVQGIEFPVGMVSSVIGAFLLMLILLLDRKRIH